jgi:CRISPR-associated protein Csd1
MILQALCELAQREHLIDDPDFQVARVAWLIRVDGNGHMVGTVQSRHEEVPVPVGSRKKPRQIALPMTIPRQMASRSNNPPPQFLVDNASFVLGADTKDKRLDGKERRRRADLFLKDLKACGVATCDEGILAVTKFLSQVQSGQETVGLPDNCRANDLFAFVFEPDVDLPVHLRQVVQLYWRKQRGGGSDKGSFDRFCFVTGKPCNPVDKHKRLKFPRFQNKIALISFNASAFESHGWKENQNAPISREASEACMVALDRVLDPAPVNPKDTNLRLSRRNIELSSDTVVCFWTRATGEGFADGFGYSLAVNEAGLASRSEQVAEMYRSIWKGKRYLLPKPDAFYSMTMTSGQGRITLRDWIESNTQTVADHLANYFADIEMVRCCPPSRDKPHPPSFSMPLLLEAIADPCDRRPEGVPPHLASSMFRSAVTGAAFPVGVFERAVSRYRSEVRKETELDGGWQTMEWNDARAALIKAVLVRGQRTTRTVKAGKEVKAAMNPMCREAGYLLGQLMAVLERLQLAALGKVDATIVDRYFNGASIAPKSVFVSLLRNARHHASKARDDRGNAWISTRLERLIDHLASGFVPGVGGERNGTGVPSDCGFPANLDLSQQGLFVLGYHQMRKWLWMTEDERRSWEQENGGAPRAYLWQQQ